MAAVTITHVWPDGSATQVKVESWDWGTGDLCDTATVAVAALKDAWAAMDEGE